MRNSQAVGAGEPSHDRISQARSVRSTLDFDHNWFFAYAFSIDQRRRLRRSRFDRAGGSGSIARQRRLGGADDELVRLLAPHHDRQTVAHRTPRRRAIRSRRHAGRLRAARHDESRAGVRLGSRRREPRRQPWGGRVSFRNGGCGARSGAPRQGRHRVFALSQTGDGLRLAASDELDAARSRRAFAPAAGTGDVLERQHAKLATGRTGTADRDLSARRGAVARELPRGRRRLPLRQQLSRTPAPRGQRY